ncbi:MAG: hypothetical protein M3R67_11915 [Acidobacteriota bacterium]|nr:hypothetical protein [Acidobacteriota bacterium]
MRLTTIHVFAFTFLVLCAAVIEAQQPVDDTKIAQMRVTVQKLEGLVGDVNIPSETQEQLNELLFEKRGELFVLLRQKRDALRSSLRGNISPGEANNINKAIGELNQEMRQLRKGAATLTSASGDDAEARDGGATSDSARSLNGNSSDDSTKAITAEPTTPVTTPGSVSSSPVTSTPITATAQPGNQNDPCIGLPSGPAPPDVEYLRQIKAAACRMFRARAGVGNRSDRQLNFQAYNFLMALAIARSKLPKVAIPELTAQAENASHSKNLGAGESSAGSTSLVAKAAVPAIFGFATENGGLVRTTSGTTVTFTGNPVGLVQSMAKRGFIDSFQEQDDFTKFLRKLSFAISFDTSRGSQPGTFTADQQQVSSYAFRYNIVDQRDPRDRRHTDRWQAITSKQAANLALSLNSFVRELATTGRAPQIEAWLVSANEGLKDAASFDDIQRGLVEQLNKLADVELPPDQKTLVEQVGTDFDAFIEERNDILDEIANGWIATLDYNNLRPVGTASLSNFRFLVEKGAYKGSIDLTGNASLTFYNSRPSGPNAQALRDFRLAGQLDVPIGDVTKTGKFLISLAGRYQRLLEDETIAGTTALVPKGDIAAVQAKLTIPIRGTAFKIPLSFSYANRTELLKEREIRGNFGFTFDLDSIFAKFNPFSKN